MNPDWRAKKTRVEERLDGAVTGTASGSQYFWSDRPKARVLDVLLDRVWRGGLLLESCRATLARVHRALFPHNEQPQGIPALLTRFREGKAIKEFLHAQLVAGVNVAFAYVRLHRLNLNLERIVDGLPGEDHYADTLAPAS